MDYTLLNILNDNMPTKQKIMIHALDQFNKKGYGETSIRDIAAAVGITPGTIYSYFASKENLLSTMLNEYDENTKGMFKRVDIVPILKEEPTAKGITKCIMLSVSYLINDVYYGNLVHLIHQEQHRNALFGFFIIQRLKDTQEFVNSIFDLLKEMNVMRPDVDSEQWGALTYCIFHTLVSCNAINTMLNTPGLSIQDVMPMLNSMFDAVMEASKPIIENT